MRSSRVPFIMLACGAAAGAQSPQVVRSSGPGAWGTVRLVEEMRIGVAENDDYAFGLVRGIVVGRDGAIWVAEHRPPRVRVYTADGRLARRVGGEGAGPGEYRQVDGLQQLQDGAVAVLDARVGRITVYEPSGRFLGTVAAPPNVTLHARRGMLLYGVLGGELDTRYIVRFRIEPAAR
jgi:hypothetical protein